MQPLPVNGMLHQFKTAPTRALIEALSAENDKNS